MSIFNPVRNSSELVDSVINVGDITWNSCRSCYSNNGFFWAKVVVFQFYLLVLYLNGTNDTSIGYPVRNRSYFVDSVNDVCDITWNSSNYWC